MGRPKHYYEPGMVYLITAVTYRRKAVFAKPTNAQTAHEDIAFYAAKFRLTSLAHVIMPDHIHWVMQPSPEDFERFARKQQEKGDQPWNGDSGANDPHRFYLSKILQDYQRHVAYVVNQHRDTRGAKVWQDGFRDDALRSEEAARAAIRYTVYNPVEMGLVGRPTDYAYWSCVYEIE
jgi:putative transposase